MCSNQYNVTGKCNRVSCPLANSNYGTVLENQGKLYLCLKTVERAHLPNRLWERIKLSRNISEAKKTIEKHMKNVYPQHQIERCKRRTIKLKHMIDRMRKLELKPKSVSSNKNSSSSCSSSNSSTSNGRGTATAPAGATAAAAQQQHTAAALCSCTLQQQNEGSLYVRPLIAWWRCICCLSSLLCV